MPGSIGSGGRYDHLIEQLGGPDVPATGIVDRRRADPARLPAAGGAARGRLDVAVTVMRADLADAVVRVRRSGPLGGPARQRVPRLLGKLGRQLKWASDSGARWSVIYGEHEHEAGVVTVRDMASGEQVQVPTADVGTYFGRPSARARADWRVTPSWSRLPGMPACPA